MRILFLSAWYPFPPDNGSKLRIAHLLRGLARRHRVDLLSFAPEPPAEEALREAGTICEHVELIPEDPFAERAQGAVGSLFSIEPRSIRLRHSEAMASAVRRRAGDGYDLVIASQIHMAPYALELPNVPRLLEEIELTITREKFQRQPSAALRARHLLTWLKLRRYLQRLLTQFAGVTVVSEPELAILQPLLGRGTAAGVVPNGVDVAACAADFGPPEPNLLIHPGALSWEANFDAMSYFIGEILPLIHLGRPQARLQVTGRSTPEQIAALPTHAGVEFTGFLSDIRPAVARAWAEVVPLRLGGGTRLKVLEALAIGTPLVSTSKGVEGIELLPERDVLVADTPADFAAQTLRLLGSPALREELAANGRLVAARYDWRVCVQHLDDIIETSLGAPIRNVPALRRARGVK